MKPPFFINLQLGDYKEGEYHIIREVIVDRVDGTLEDAIIQFGVRLFNCGRSLDEVNEHIKELAEEKHEQNSTEQTS